ncbi:MAG: hypothetical protein MZV64_68275 [Ignavibacteriales bacterium]|nr:hypothetical protein [Ignavibacteriales bacterium]
MLLWCIFCTRNESSFINCSTCKKSAVGKTTGFEGSQLLLVQAVYNRLKVSQHELKFDEKMRMRIEEILEEKISNGIEATKSYWVIPKDRDRKNKNSNKKQS